VSPRLPLIAVLVLGALCAVPAAAAGATLAAAGGTLTYTAGAGHANDVIFDQFDDASVRVVVKDADPIAASGNCTPVPSSLVTYECTGIALVVADTGDGDDVMAAGLLDIPVRVAGRAGDDHLEAGHAGGTVEGGDGDDQLFTRDGHTVLDGSAGDDQLHGNDGHDVLRGGAGNDVLEPRLGADDVSGGDGFDEAVVNGLANPPPSVSVTLDDRPGDGAAGAGANVHADVEDVTGTSRSDRPGSMEFGSVTITGTAAANRLSVTWGRATIDGGAGNDVLAGGPQEDSLIARDGFADRVQCGEGEDAAVVDTLDAVGSDCEHVDRQDVGDVHADAAPTVSFFSPGAGAFIRGETGAVVTAIASDDRGVASVRFLDEERVVCEDAVAPYTCEYEPRGEDVGRNTLVAVATDTSAQTATALRSVTVRRFAPRAVTLRVARRRATPLRLALSGAVRLPARVSAAQGCRGGAVAVRVRAGRRTIATGRAALRADCSYRRTLTLRHRAGRVLRVAARSLGNPVLGPGRSKIVTLRR
jgi:Ca2+-binding RTX toxin-like protein